VEVNRHRARIERQIDGYGAFLGVPFLFTSYRNAIRYMGFGPEEAMYILLRVDKAYSISDVQQITLGSVFQRWMYSREMNLSANPARTGRSKRVRAAQF